MTKEYAEQLGQWVKERKVAKRETNLVAFLLIRDDARIALEAGYTAKTVWRNMHEAGRISFCYDTFLRHMNRLICNRKTEVPLPGHKKPPPSISKSVPPPIAQPGLSTTPSSSIKGFTFNATPNKEDLL